MLVNLTDEQNALYRNIVRWAKGNMGGYAREAFNGYAGTGKTTLLGAVASDLIGIAFASKKAIAFCAPTGKASRVLAAKLGALGLPRLSYECGTLHSLFYTRMDCVQNKDDSMFLRKDTDYIYQKYCVIIVDEASMLSEETFKDLEEFEVPILFVGDPGQLPPVQGKTMELLQKTKNTLLTVHRQALDNPIIKLATDVRLRKPILPGALHGPENSRTYVGPLKDDTVSRARASWMTNGSGQTSIILAGQNVNRGVLNRRTREVLGKKDRLPEPGEKVVCLSNDKTAGIVNGQLFSVVSCKSETENFYLMKVVPEDKVDSEDIAEHTIYLAAYKGTLMNVDKQKDLYAVAKDFFISSEFALVKESNPTIMNERMAFFDFGYCLSVHKSQGSEWQNVYLHNDELFRWDPDAYSRWLYTAITRARTCLVIETKS